MEHILAFIIFTISYIGIIAEKINRAVVACAGGLAMIMVGIIDVEKTFMVHIEWNTIALLLAMMVIVSITSQNGVFEFIAIKLAQLAGGKPIPLLITISSLTAVGSAFLDNVTTVLLLVPIIMTLTSILNVTSIPFLITIILFSNIGGTATLIGDPPNIMIGQAVEHLDFLDFLYNLAPIVGVVYLVILGYVIILYRKSLYISKANQLKLLGINAASYLKKGALMYKSVTVLCLTIIGFLVHPIFHIDLTTVAMAGAIVLMLITQKEQDAEEVFKSIEWVTIFFFVGLFMLIGGLKDVGIIDEIARSILHYTNGDLPLTAIFILWGSGIISGFVDNIPFVAAMIPVISEFQEYGMSDLDPLWWSLALGSCLGGNATLIGASANVIVAGFAAKAKQPISFIKFMKIGIQVVFLSLIISTIYIYFRYLIPYIY